MKLSPEEQDYVRHWIHDEWHYRSGQRPAKRLQLEHRAVAADLATLIAAAVPDPLEQEAIALGPQPSGEVGWPWAEGEFEARVLEARSILEKQMRREAPV